MSEPNHKIEIKPAKHYPAVDKLAEVLRRLRAPGGCPWDREQTHSSLIPYLIEEVYEAIDAIETGGREALRGELGDLLMHIIFHAQIAAEDGEFDLEEVAADSVDKLVRRHPHVFGEPQELTPEQVKDNWEAIKLSQENRSLLSGVPPSLPALLAAYRVQEKAGGVGFEWEDISGVEAKFREEWAEFEESRKSGDREKMTEEFGDMLFVLVNLGRYLGIDAELALKRTVQKFIKRFEYIEKRLAEKGSSPQESNLEEMDSYWDEAKDMI